MIRNIRTRLCNVLNSKYDNACEEYNKKYNKLMQILRITKSIDENYRKYPTETFQELRRAVLHYEIRQKKIQVMETE